jgi:hypothetical protein
MELQLHFPDLTKPNTGRFSSDVRSAGIYPRALPVAHVS